MGFVLIVLIIGWRQSVPSQVAIDFASRERCEAAGRSYAGKITSEMAQHVVWTCEPLGKP